MSTWILGINTCFAIKRWPRPRQWACIVRDEFGLDLVQHTLDLVELGGSDSLVAAQAESLRESCRDLGLCLDSTFTGLVAYSSNMLLDPDEPMRSHWEHWIRRAIRFTEQSGAAFTGGHFGALSVAEWHDPAARAERWAGLRDALRRLTAEAKSAGLQGLYLENMAAAREPATMLQIEDLITEGDPSHAPVNLCLDIGHQCVPGARGEERSPYAWLSRFGSRLGCVHLQQTDAEGDHHWPFTDRHNAEGRIDAHRVLRTLETAGADEVKLFLEIIPPSEQDDDEVLQDIGTSVAHWRNAIDAHRANSPLAP